MIKSLLLLKKINIPTLRTDLELLDRPINSQPLNDAVNNLKLAAEGYIKGDFNMIFNVRNALANNLIEKVGRKKRIKRDHKGCVSLEDCYKR
jgi:hypothetical protein